MKARVAEKNVELLKQQYSKNPDSLIFSRLADTFRKDGDIKQAVELCKQGIEKHPEYVTGRIILGRCYIEQEDYQQAIEEFVSVCKIDRKNQVAIKILADLFVKQGKLETAGDLYRVLLRMDPFEQSFKILSSRFDTTGKVDLFDILGIGETQDSPTFADTIDTNDSSLENVAYQNETPVDETISGADIENTLDGMFDSLQPETSGITQPVNDNVQISGADINERMEALFGNESEKSSSPVVPENTQRVDMDSSFDEKPATDVPVSSSDISSRIDELFDIPPSSDEDSPVNTDKKFSDPKYDITEKIFPDQFKQQRESSIPAQPLFTHTEAERPVSDNTENEEMNSVFGNRETGMDTSDKPDFGFNSNQDVLSDEFEETIQFDRSMFSRLNDEPDYEEMVSSNPFAVPQDKELSPDQNTIDLDNSEIQHESSGPADSHDDDIRDASIQFQLQSFDFSGQTGNVPDSDTDNNENVIENNNILFFPGQSEDAEPDIPQPDFVMEDIIDETGNMSLDAGDADNQPDDIFADHSGTGQTTIPTGKTGFTNELNSIDESDVDKVSDPVLNPVDDHLFTADISVDNTYDSSEITHEEDTIDEINVKKNAGIDIIDPFEKLNQIDDDNKDSLILSSSFVDDSTDQPELIGLESNGAVDDDLLKIDDVDTASTLLEVSDTGIPDQIQERIADVIGFTDGSTDSLTPDDLLVQEDVTEISPELITDSVSDDVNIEHDASVVSDMDVLVIDPQEDQMTGDDVAGKIQEIIDISDGIVNSGKKDGIGFPAELDEELPFSDTTDFDMISSIDTKSDSFDSISKDVSTSPLFPDDIIDERNETMVMDAAELMDAAADNPENISETINVSDSHVQKAPTPDGFPEFNSDETIIAETIDVGYENNNVEKDIQSTEIDEATANPEAISGADVAMRLEQFFGQDVSGISSKEIVPDDDDAEETMIQDFYTVTGENAATSTGVGSLDGVDKVEFEQGAEFVDENEISDTSDTTADAIDHKEQIPPFNAASLFEPDLTVSRSDENEKVTYAPPSVEIDLDNDSAGQHIDSRDTPYAIPDHVLTPTLADIYFQQGQYQLAHQIYTRLLEKDPDNEKLKDRIDEIKQVIDLEPPTGLHNKHVSVADLTDEHVTARKRDIENPAQKDQRPLAGVRIPKKGSRKKTARKKM